MASIQRNGIGREKKCPFNKNNGNNQKCPTKSFRYPATANEKRLKVKRKGMGIGLHSSEKFLPNQRWN